MPSVYPRVCGGTGYTMRMRQIPPRRSIPAYAGEPPAHTAARPTCAVYPRVCGGTKSYLRLSRRVPGLSPRMRGEPPSAAARGRRKAVYPRVCGGTCRKRASRCLRTGLSPRMRGNLFASRHQAPPAGSIPAYAGEPVARRSPPDSTPVYPRVCGGTRATRADCRAG